MKSLRKSIAIILAVLMLASVIPMASLAADEVPACPNHGTKKIQVYEGKAATCTEPGITATYQCSQPKCTFTAGGETIPQLDHSYTGEFKFDEEAKTHSQLCVNGCNEYGAPTACEFESKVTKPASCQGAGETTYTCKDCGGEYTEEIPASVHDFSGNVKANDDGTHSFKCVNDGCEEYGKVTECAGGEANCVEKAVCETCGEDYGEVDSTNHKGGETISAQEATCEQIGWGEYEVCECGAKLDYNEKTQLDHSYTGTYKFDEATKTHSQLCVNGCNEYGEATDCKFESQVTKSASCQEAGETTYTCKDCGGEYTEEIPASVHDFSGDVRANDDGTHSFKCVNDGCEEYGNITECTGGEATCTAKAVCEVCGKAYGETNDENHKMIPQNGTPATCTEDGYSDYQKCEYCGEEIEKTENKATGHDWEATFTWNGYESATAQLVCKNDSTHTETVVATVTSKTTSGDCYNDKIVTYTATVDFDGKEFTDTKKENLGQVHDFIEIALPERMIVAGTCATEALYYMTCKTCNKSSKGFGGATFTGDFDLTNHEGESATDEATVVAATCTKEGYNGDKICSSCGEVVEYGEVTPPINHNFTAENAEERYLKSEADCQNKAVYYKSCATCGETSEGTEAEAVFENGELNPDKHQPEETYIVTNEYNYGENCQNGGKTITKCPCGVVMYETTFKGHATAHVAAKAPTCTEPGNYSYYYCSRCNYSIFGDRTEIPASGHKPVILPAVEATCTKTGFTEGQKCSECNEILNAQEEIPIKEHTFELVERVEPTCTEDGHTEGLVCTVCGLTDGEYATIPTTGHSPIMHEAVAASCTEDGSIEYYTCEKCDRIWKYELKEDETQEEVEIKLEDTVVPKGHEWNEEKVEYTKEPTCTEAGKGTFSCKNCTVVEEREVPALGHDWEEGETFASTCDKDGYTEYTCSRCPETKQEVNKDDLHKGHQWEDDYTIDVEPSCEKSGEKSIHCKVCKEKKLYLDEGKYYESWQEATKCEGGRKDVTQIEPLPHKYLDTTIPATCTTAGEHYKECENCGNETAHEAIPALGHNFVAISGDPATCETDSTQVLKCTRCSVQKNDDAKKFGHTDKDKNGICDNCKATLCSCLCHRTDTFGKILYKIVLFFWDLLGIKQTCECGKVHYTITHM